MGSLPQPAALGCLISTMGSSLVTLGLWGPSRPSERAYISHSTRTVRPLSGLCQSGILGKSGGQGKDAVYHRKKG